MTSDFWKGFFSVIIILALVVVYSETRQEKQPQIEGNITPTTSPLTTAPANEPEVKSVIQILLGKEAVNIREEDVKVLQSNTQSKLNELKSMATSNINTKMEVGLIG